MVRHFAPLGLLLALGCGGSDAIGPTAASNDLTTMNVGEVRVFNPANVWNGFYLPSGPSARDFIVIIGNTNPRQDVVASYVVQADQSTAATFGVAAAADLSAQSSFFVTQGIPSQTLQQAVDTKLRAFERSGLTLQSASGPAGISALSPRRAIQVAAASVPVPGDLLNLKIPDESSKDPCTNFFRTQAVVASVSRRAILAVDTLDGPPLTVFTQPVLDSIAREFDDITYPTDSAYFNNPTDVDGNNRVIMLFTGEVNKLTPSGQRQFTAGFFFAGDFFPATGTKAGTFCPQSNGAEIFYLLAPDPSGKFNNVRTTSEVRQGTRGIIAHEFQHMINAGNRYQNPAVNEFEAVWLDEALAHFAEDAVGRVQRGFTDLQTLTLADLVPPGNTQANNDFNAFFFLNLARLTYWMARPDTSSGISARADENLSSRGAGWALLRYSADNYSNGDPRALTRKLAAGPKTGVANLTLATTASLDTLVSGWLVSMYADHLGIAGLDAKYQYRSYNFRNVMPVVARSVFGTQTAVYPLQVVSIGSGRDTIPSTNRAGSGTYYSLSVAANAPPVTVNFAIPPFPLLNCCIETNSEWRRRFFYPGAHIYVLRVQ